MASLHEHTSQLSASILKAKQENVSFGIMMGQVQAMLRTCFPSDQACADAETQLSDRLYPVWGGTEEAVRSALTALLGEKEQDDNAALVASEEVFVAAIADDPKDNDVRLLFAGWLQERGDPRAAMALRVPTNALFLRLWREIPAAYVRQMQEWKRDQQEFPHLHIPNPPPLDAVWKTFTPTQWAALEHLSEPALILIPPISFLSSLELLNRHQPHKPPPYQTHSNGLDEHSAPATWRACFVEGAQDMPEPPQAVLLQELGERLKAEEDAQTRLRVQGIDRHLYAWLMLDSLARGQPVDTDTWTVLNADPACQVDRSSVPVARFLPISRQVYFGWDLAGARRSGARLRRSVGGDVA